MEVLTCVCVYVCVCVDPGYEPGSGEEDGSSGLTQALMIVVLWFIVALVLFLFR